MNNAPSTRRIAAIVLLLAAGPMLFSSAQERSGRGMNGFDLSFSLIDTGEIGSGGPGKDGIPSLTDPKVVPVRKAGFLNDSDDVIGVSIGGEARAYPLPILVWHEAVNDTLGGVPILVSYCPLCRSALVFKREIGGKEREFGISGLLYRSNVLLYDRQSSASQESLWSQAAMRAVSGPAARAGLRLELVDSTLSTFADWKATHPDSTVVSPKTGHSRAYDKPAYAGYFATDHLMFPVKGRTPRRPDLNNKDEVLVVKAHGEMRAYPLADFAKAPGNEIEDELGGVPLRLVYHPDSRRVDVESDTENDVTRAYMFWFTYDAFYPEGQVYSPR